MTNLVIGGSPWKHAGSIELGGPAPPSQETAMDTQTSAVLIYVLFRHTHRLDRNAMAESTPYRYAPASRSDLGDRHRLSACRPCVDVVRLGSCSRRF